MLTFEELLVLKTDAALKKMPSLNDLKDSWLGRWGSQPVRSRSSTLPSGKRRRVSFAASTTEYTYYDPSDNSSKEDLQVSKEDLRASQESLTKLVQDFEMQLIKNKEKYEGPIESVEEALIRRQLEIEYEEEKAERKIFQLSNNSISDNTSTDSFTNDNAAENLEKSNDETDELEKITCSDLTGNTSDGLQNEEPQEEDIIKEIVTKTDIELQETENNIDDVIEINDNNSLIATNSTILDTNINENDQTKDCTLPVSDSNGVTDTNKHAEVDFEHEPKNKTVHDTEEEKVEESHCHKEAKCTGCFSESLTLAELFTNGNGADFQQEVGSCSSPSSSFYKLSPSKSSTMESITEELEEEKALPLSNIQSTESSRPSAISCRSSSSSEEFVTPMLSPEEYRMDSINKQNNSLSPPIQTSFFCGNTPKLHNHGEIRGTLSPGLSPLFGRRLELGNERCDLCEMCDSYDDSASICSLDYMKLDEAPDEYLEGWMERLPSRLHHLPLCQLIIPGSHISIAVQNDMRTDLDFSQCNKAMLDALGKLPDFAVFNRFKKHMKSLWKAWMPKQRLSLLDQLKSGARFLHWRLAKRESIVYGAHGLYTKPSLSYIQDISSFCSRNRREVVMLHVEALANMDKVATERWLDEVYDELGVFLVERTKKFSDLSLKSVWATGRNLLLFIPNCSSVSQALRRHKIRNYVWSDRHLEIHAFRVQNVEDLVKKMDESYSKISAKKNKEKLIVIRAVLAPDWEMVFGDYEFASLKQLNDVVVHDRLNNWLIDKPYLNVVSFDFVGSKFLMRNCINLNALKRAETTV